MVSRRVWQKLRPRKSWQLSAVTGTTSASTRQQSKKFTLDSKAPTESYQDFLDGEVRYNSLKRANPEKAARLFAKSEAEANERYEYLQRLVTMYSNEEK